MANGDAGDVHSLNSAQRKIQRWIYELHTKGFIGGKNISIGRIEPRMRKYAEDNKIQLASGHLYMGPRSVAHALRVSKIAKEIAVPEMAIVAFAKSRRNMDLFWDGESFIYTDYENKFIIHPNYSIKVYGHRERKVNFVTAGKVSEYDEFDNPKYKKV